MGFCSMGFYPYGLWSTRFSSLRFSHVGFCSATYSHIDTTILLFSFSTFNYSQFITEILILANRDMKKVGELIKALKIQLNYLVVYIVYIHRVICRKIPNQWIMAAIILVYEKSNKKNCRPVSYLPLLQNI